MTVLGYIAQTDLRHEGEVYGPGDDVSHFAPLIPHLVASVSVGHVQLVVDGEPLPIRYEVMTNPYVYGLMVEDIEAQAAGGADADNSTVAAESPSGDAPPAPEFDPADHVIDDVLAYIAENPDALDDVIALEASGKARSTLLAKLEALAEPTPNDDPEVDE